MYPPKTKCRNEARIFAETGFSVAKDARIEFRLSLRKVLEYKCQHQHTATGNHPAIIAPSPPVARPNAAGNENIPAPIIAPTTSVVKDQSDSVLVVDLFI